MSKYYAVKVGRETGVFRDWKTTEGLVKGYTGAIYKSFKTEIEAKKFLDTEDISEETKNNTDVDELVGKLTDDEIIMITDGSFDKVSKRYGYGMILKTAETEDRFYNSGDISKFAESENVAGEVFGVVEGLKICSDKGYKKVYLYFDYIGLEEWAKKKWKANAEISRYYLNQLEKYSDVDIEFIKVEAHTGHLYNEEADRLAKFSMKKQGSKTYNDGTVYITGIDKVQIENILSSLKSEYDEEQSTLSIVEDIEEYRTNYKISVNKQKIVINYYFTNYSLYIQGKKSDLFSLFVEKLISQMENSKGVNKILNKVYSVDIEEDTVVSDMKKYIPNYEIDDTKNIGKIIYSAVFNLNINSFKKDYSDLAHPTFRIIEHILHQILGNTMNLSTDNDGRNNFGYFSIEESTGKYICNHPNISLLSEEQRVLLENVYNFYNKHRHIYSHTSSIDIDTSIIERFDYAQEIILEGLSMFDNYCKVF